MNYQGVNKRTSLFLLLWYLLLKSGRAAEENSIDANLCSIRFYSVKYFSGNTWTLTSGEGWKYSTDTLLRRPYGNFLPKSIRTYGNASKCKDVWKICPLGATVNKRKPKCRILRHGEAISSVREWGWNNSFLRHVKSLKKTRQTTSTTTTGRAPHPSLPLKIPKNISIERNIKDLHTTTLQPPNSIEKSKYKEADRSSVPEILLESVDKGIRIIF